MPGPLPPRLPAASVPSLAAEPPATPGSLTFDASTNVCKLVCPSLYTLTPLPCTERPHNAATLGASVYSIKKCMDSTPHGFRRVAHSAERTRSTAATLGALLWRSGVYEGVGLNANHFSRVCTRDLLSSYGP